MPKKGNKKLRKYIEENLDSGYSRGQIKKALLEAGYDRKIANSIMNEYARPISNMALAGFVVLFVMISLIGNYMLVSLIYPNLDFTGHATTGGARVTFCVNNKPTIS